ncbi:MAG: Uma2 family endonuclease [Gemmatimonadales bacterium]
MVMPSPATRWTREMVLALPDDGNRYELFDGELLVTPAPSAGHQWAVAALFARLLRYLEGTGIAFVCTSPADLRLEGGQIAQPDLFVIPPRPDGSRPARWEDFAIPLLVVEVLSPSTAPADRITKRRRYQRTRVPEYWVVDRYAQVVERWRPGEERPEILDERLVWEPVAGVPPLVIDLAEMFRDVPREAEGPGS